MPNAYDKIKIVYLIDFFGAGGGTENQLTVLIKNLDRSRFTPCLVTLRSKEHYVCSDLNCPVQHLDIQRLLSVKAVRALGQFVKFLRQNRVNILQLFFIDSNIFGVIAGRLASVPAIIVSRRDMGWWYHQQRRHVTNLLNRMTHYCIANAEAVKRAVVKMETVAPERIRVIYNGVEVGAPDSRAALTRASFGIPDRFPVVGIVANLKSIKRIDRFLRAAARLKRTDCHFIVLGAGPLEGTLKTLAQELGVLPRVHFYHTVEQTREIVSLFDVGLLTSESEGLSNVLIEYALAGIPAVAFNVGGNNEVVVDEQTGFLVNPFDEQMLVERVDDLLDHPEVAQRLGRAAQLRARDKFSVVSMVTQTERFYFEIAGSGLPKQFR